MSFEATEATNLDEFRAWIRRPPEQPTLFDLDGSLCRLAAKPGRARHEV